MEFRYCDRNGTNLKPDELEKLDLWNPIMEHILAGVLHDAGMVKITQPGMLEE